MTVRTNEPGPDTRDLADTQVSRMAGNTAILLGGQILNTLLATGVAIVLVRYLGREEYGLLSTTFAYLSFFLTLTSAGVDTIVTREVSRTPERAGELVSAAAGLRLALSVGSMILSWALLPLLAPEPRLALLVVVVTLSLPLSFYSLYLVLFAVQLRMGWPKLVFAAWSLLFSAGKLGMVAGGLPLEAFVAVELVSSVVVYILARELGRRSGLRVRIRFRRAEAGALLREAWPVAVTLSLIQVYLRLDQVMLYRMVGPEEVGLYAVAVRMVELLNIVPIVFMNSAFPILSRLSMEPGHDRLDSATRMSFRAMAWVALPFAAGLFLYGSEVITLLFGAEFQPSAVMLVPLAWTLPFIYLNSVIYNQSFSSGRQQLALRMAIVAAAANVLLNAYLIPIHGGWGAALATLLSYAMVPVVALGSPGSRKLGRAGLLSLLRPGAAVLVPLAALLWMGPPGFLVGGALLVTGYVALLVLSGEWGRAEWALLRRVTGR